MSAALALGPVAGADEALVLFAAPGPINSLALSPGGTAVAVGDHEDAITVWTLPTGKVRCRLKGPGRSALGLHFLTETTLLAATAERDGEALSTRLNTWDLTTEAVVDTAVVPGVFRGLSGDGKLVVTQPWPVKNVVRVTRLADKTAVRLVGAPGAIYKTALAPDGRSVATVGGRTVKVWDFPAGRERWSRPTDEHMYLQSLFFSPDSRVLVASHTFSEFWDAATGKAAYRPSLMWSPAAFRPGGKALVSADPAEAALLIFAVGKEAPSATLPAGKGGPAFSCQFLAVSADGRWAATAGENHVVRLWLLPK